MKISHLIIALLVLAIGCAGVYYSLEQQKIMKLLIAAHGGDSTSSIGATGLRKTLTDVASESEPISSSRKEALDRAAKSLDKMILDREQRNRSKSELDNKKSELASKQDELAAAEKKVQEMNEKITALCSKIKTQIPGDWEDASGLVETMEKLKNLVQEQSEINTQRKAEYAEKQVLRTAAIEKVSGQMVDLNKIAAINEEFFDNYCKNDDEFTISAVNTNWKFVVFRVPENSGLVAGDTTPVIVKRDGVKIARLRIVNISANNVVIAEYDPASMPAGVSLQVGDRVFREKPLGS